MISALVDLINRTRRDHVITIESEINIVHERGTSFISQREVRGSYDDVDRRRRGRRCAKIRTCWWSSRCARRR